MGVPRFFLLLRRTRPTSSIFLYRHRSLFTNPIIASSSLISPSNIHSLRPPTTYHCNHSFTRFFSSSNHQQADDDIHSDQTDSVANQPDFANFQVDIGQIGAGVYGDSILPIRALISLLDFYHDLTGLPWWMVIASSTIMMRFALFPFIVLQLRKLKRIGELLPKLPPPLPPPLSGRSLSGQFKLFLKEKQAVGCPSLFWFLASFGVQVPFFFLWITTIRRMSLGHHPGFDCGGTLWFQNLTEYPNGVLGPIVPFFIAGLHYANVQISFHKSSLGEMPGLLAKLAKYYKISLEILMLPILFVTFNVPQGSLIYWFTNSSLSLFQQLTLRHPAVRIKLGLPNKEDSHHAKENHKEAEVSGALEMNQSGEQRKLVSARDLSPAELVNVSLVYLSRGNKDRALPLLRLAIEKDPENARALLVMGQVLLKDRLLVDAAEYFERVISKLSLSGHPMETEDVDLLILSSQWAGVAYVQQDKYQEGITHLERVASLDEPEDAKSKAHYYDGLVLLCSALYNVERKAEALKYARMAAAYDSHYSHLIEQIEKDEDELVSNLVRSRRADY